MTFNKVPTQALAVWGLVGVAFGYAVLGVNSRLLSVGFEPMTQVYVRIAVGLLLSLLLFNKQIRIEKIKTVPRSDLFWLSIMGVVGYSLGVWFITLANLNAKLVNAWIIYSTIPFVVYAYSYFLLKEKIRPKVIALLLVSLYGISVVASKSLIPQVSAFGMGELFAFLSVLAGGWWSVGRKKVSNYLNNKEITVITMFIAALTGLIIALVKGEELILSAFLLPQVIVGIMIGAVLNLILTYFENFSFQHINVVLGNQILMSSIIFSLILGFLLYNEQPSPVEILGGILIFVSVWFANKLLTTE